MQASSRAQKIEPFYVMEVAKAASKLGNEVAHTDAPMVFLNIGEPDFTAPPLVRAAAVPATQNGATQSTPAQCRISPRSSPTHHAIRPATR